MTATITRIHAKLGTTSPASPVVDTYTARVGGYLIHYPAGNPPNNLHILRDTVVIERNADGYYLDGCGGFWSSLRNAAESRVSHKHGTQFNLVTLKTW